MNMIKSRSYPWLCVLVLVPVLGYAKGGEIESALRAAIEAAHQANVAAQRANDAAHAAESETARLREQLAQLQARVASQEKRISKQTNLAASPTSDLQVASHGDGIKFASADGSAKFHVGGRIMADTAIYNDDRSNLGNGAELRRARLFLAGTVYENWQFKGQYDFAGNKVAIKDAYLRYNGWPVQITLGNHHEPFGLEELTSSKYITFMERGLPGVFSPSRNFGLSAGAHGRQWSARAGIFGKGINNTTGGDEGYGFTGRVTYAPILQKQHSLHFGAAFSHRDFGDVGTTKFRERAESHITEVRLINTGTLADADSMNLLGLETAAVLGPFSVQSEYTHASVNRNAGSANADFSGWYAYASWFLTGESRAYNGKSGTFGRVHPKTRAGIDGIGAWELGLRYSELDLSDADVFGGQQKDLTLGLNWYLAPSIRLMANYVKVLQVQGGPNDNDEPSVFQLRGQIDF